MRPFNQDMEQVNPETPRVATENAGDEAGILSDQDETMLAHANEDGPNIGSDGTEDDFGLGSSEFARGEVDVKEQMDRTTAAMDASLHRPRDPNVTPFSTEGAVEPVEELSATESTNDDKQEEHLKRGGETGAYTDVGAGKSGTTRVH